MRISLGIEVKFCPVHPFSDPMLKCQEEMLTQIQIKFPRNSITGELAEMESFRTSFFHGRTDY